MATGQSADSFFNSFSESKAALISPQQLVAAQVEVVDLFRPVVNLSGMRSFVNDALVPVVGSQYGNQYDQFLDQINAAMRAKGTSYASVARSLLTQGDLGGAGTKSAQLLWAGTSLGPVSTPSPVTETATATATAATATSTPAANTSAAADAPANTAATATSTARSSASAPAPAPARPSSAAPAAQTITFAGPAAQTMGVATTALSATATSGLAVNFTSSTPSVCTVAGTSLTLVTAGTCTVVARQGGNTSYLAATSVSRTFTVEPAATASSLQLSTTSLSFGAQENTSQSSVRTATLTNAGTTSIILINIGLTGTSASDFLRNASTTCAAGQNLAPMAACSYAVSFLPSTLGSKSASIAIAHTAAGGSASIALDGTSQTTPASALQTAVTYAANTAATAITAVQNFIAATYATITFDPNTNPRSIAPTATAAAPASTVVTSNSLNWSNAAFWGGTLPTAGSDVVIPTGTTVMLDSSTPSLGNITVNGTLKFANQDVNLTAKSISIASTGALQIGEPGSPFAFKAIITLTGAKGSADNTRGITVTGGKLELYGATPSPVWTQLNDHAAANTKNFTLKDPVNWKAGDTIAVGPSDYYGVNPTERLTLADTATGNTLTTTQALAKFRWGKMQYMTDTGLSLTPGTYTPHVTPAPTQLDQRAAVGNLTRNIVIQGANDADWSNSGFGAHVMVMNLASKVFVDGVEFHRVGQAGKMARYPFHWHMLSYDPANGSFLGNATGQEIRNSAIWQSAQRCVVVHGTNGVKVTNNICQDIKGHAFFLEDAVERKNTFEGNLALMIRSPEAQDMLLRHEGDVHEAGPSGFWITNPDNIIRNNVVGDAVGNAYWNSFPSSGVGLNRKVKNPDLAGTQWANAQMNPVWIPHGVFDNNVGYSTGQAGINTDQMLEGGGPVGDDLGNVSPGRYQPTLDGRPHDINGQYVPGKPGFDCDAWPTPVQCRSTTMRATFSRVTLYKTNQGYRNRINAPDYPEWVMADITGSYAAGAGDDGGFMRGLFIGKSLNNLTAYPSGAEPQAMFATYHSTFQMRDNTMAHIGYQESDDPERTSSGVFKSDDYYISQMERGTMLNANNRLIDAFAGSRHYPANLYSRPPFRPDLSENFSLAGAIWDPYGYWGNKGFYWTYDVPFLTAGGGCTPSLFPTAGGKNSAGKYNGQSCSGEFYGMTHQEETDFLKPDSNASYWPVDIERLDCNPASYNSTSIGPATRACRWVVGSGWESWKLGNFRGASLRNGGEYKVMYPDPGTPPNVTQYGAPNFNSPAVQARTRGTMVNAEGATVPISIPKVVNIQFTNMKRAEDSVVMAVSFDGTKTPTALYGRTDNVVRWRWLLQPNPNTNMLSSQDISKARVLTLANSLAEVKSDANGTKMWQDRANNLVWIKVVGSLPLGDSWYRIENFTAPFGQNLYEEISLYMKDNTIPNQ